MPPFLERRKGVKGRPADVESLVNQDPMDPKFDLESYFEALMQQKA